MLKKIFLSDNKIIRRIQDNDRTILGELFLNNDKLIGSYISKNGGSQTDAKAILHEAIIVLWQNVNSGRFDLSAKVSTYLFAVAKNKWMAESRRRKKLEYSVEGLERMPSSEDSLGNIIEDEANSQVGEALEALGPPCKDILILYYFEERNMNDIAEILNFANSNVAKAKKYQCKKALEKLMRTRMRLEN